MKLRLLLLIALPYSAFSQTTLPPKPGSTVCLPVAIAARNADSLKVLPKVRRVATKWRVAASRYKLAADTSSAAYLRQVQANGSTQLALRDQKVETARQESYVKEWKGKARRRNVWGWLKAVGGVLIGLGIGAAAR